LKGARIACRTHLEVDGMDGPLWILTPDGSRLEEAVKDECGRVTIRTSSLSRKYETEVVSKWDVRMLEMD
jgi:hypothetical protein